VVLSAPICVEVSDEKPVAVDRSDLGRTDHTDMGDVEIVELRARQRSELLVAQNKKLRRTEHQGALELRNLRRSKTRTWVGEGGRESCARID